MRALRKLPVWLLAMPLMWVALAAPRNCGSCLPFKLVSWEVGIDAVELVLENPAGSLNRPASLVELLLDDEIVGQAMIGPVGIGERVGFVINWKLPRRIEGEADLRVLADGDFVGVIEAVVEGPEEAPAPEVPIGERAPPPRAP
jgi:hypothetical protein